MSVYVDCAEISIRRMIMCFMFADTVEELHDMAKKLRVNPGSSFINRGTPFYVVCLKKKRLAISYGAIEINNCEKQELLKRI